MQLLYLTILFIIITFFIIYVHTHFKFLFFLVTLHKCTYKVYLHLTQLNLFVNTSYRVCPHFYGLTHFYNIIKEALLLIIYLSFFYQYIVFLHHILFVEWLFTQETKTIFVDLIGLRFSQRFSSNF